MKKNICFLLILLYPTFLFSQTPAILKKLVGGELFVTATSGSAYIKDNVATKYIRYYGNLGYLDFKPAFSSGVGVGYNTDFGRIGIGTKVTMSFMHSKIEDKAYFFVEYSKQLIDNYWYISNPIYLRIKLYKNINMSIGAANNFAVADTHKNFVPDTFSYNLLDLYKDKKYYTQAYFALSAKIYKRFSFDIEYMRTSDPFRIIEGRTRWRPEPAPQDPPEHLEYNKYQFMLSVNYQLNYKKK